MESNLIITINCSDDTIAHINKVVPHCTISSDSNQLSNCDLAIINICEDSYEIEDGNFQCLYIVDTPEKIETIEHIRNSDVIFAPLRINELSIRIKSLLKYNTTKNDLVETKHILSRLEEAGKMGYFIADLTDDSKNRMSDAGYKMLGCEPQDHVPSGESFETFLHPDDLHKLIECRDDMMNQGYADKEFRVQRRDNGEWFWMLARTAFLDFNEKGEPIKTIGIHQDITRLKNQEAIIDLEHKQFLSILDSIPQPMYVADLDTYELLFINNAIRSNEKAGDNPQAKKCYELFYNFSKPCKFCSNSIIRNQKEPYIWDKKNPINDRHYKVTDQVIKWSDGRDVRFCACIDITEQMQISDILREELALNKQKLGMASLHHISKNDLLEELRNQLEQFRENAIKNDDIKKLLLFIDKSLKVDEQWDSFKKHFEEVHSGFFTRLSSKYPKLTDRERKVCAYYRINLSNKEISLLLGIEPDSVKKSRNRLRKKLELHSEQPLVSFLESI